MFSEPSHITVRTKQDDNIDILRFYPTKKYKTIMLDPPWPIKWQPGAFTNFKGLPYNVMTIAEIALIPIKEMCDPTGTKVIMWVVNEFMPEAFGLIRLWGLQYVKLFTYIKPCGLGRPPYNCTEHAIIAHRGFPANPRTDYNARTWNWYRHPRKVPFGHKPDALIKKIETFTFEPRLEIFARSKRKGWESTGNQLTWIEEQKKKKPGEKRKYTKRKQQTLE